MQVHETIVERYNRLPLPAAHLVVDVRGTGDRRSTDWLQMELEDFAQEMASFEVPRWHNVRKFLSFLHLPPHAQNDFFPQDEVQMEEASASSRFLEQQSTQGQEEDGTDFVQEIATFAQEKKRLVEEIDSIRGYRLSAMQETSKTGRPASGLDARVRVLFLVDLVYPESLSCARQWAKQLKNHFRQRPGHQAELCIALVCLGNVAEKGKLGLLLDELSQHQARTHLDALILCENYLSRPPLEGPAPAHIAAHLLYALLMFFSSSFTFFPTATPAPLASWPVPAYRVHIVALEYSARWGRRWLNNSLVRALINTLCPEAALSAQERRDAADQGIDWFHDWWKRLREHMLSCWSDLDGLPRVRQVPLPSLPIFVMGRRGGKNVREQLDSYLDQLADTYVASGSEPSLQDVLLQGRTQIMQQLSVTESAPNERSNLRVLRELQSEARSLFSTARFWDKVSLPLAAAPFFLEGLAGACADLQRDCTSHTLNPLIRRPQDRAGQSGQDAVDRGQYWRDKDIKARKEDLLARGHKDLSTLAVRLSRWPLLTSAPILRILAQWCTFLVQAVLTILVLFLVIAVLHPFVAKGIAGLQPLFASLLLNLLVCACCALLIFYEFRALNAGLVRQRDNLMIVSRCLLFLALLGLCGLLAGWIVTSLGRASDDTISVVYLNWLSSFASLAARIAIPTFVAILTGEAVSLLFWSSQVRAEYQGIVSTWRQQQKQDIQAVIDFLAMDIALEIAQRAELCKRSGGPGLAFYRVRQLPNILRSLAKLARQYEQLAAERLLLSQESVLRHDREWIQTHIGSEELEVELLVSEQARLRQHIQQDRALQRMLAEYLLRAEGAETPEELERALRAHLSESENTHKPLLKLLLFLAGLTARYTLDPLPVSKIDLNKGDYGSEQRYIEEELPALRAYVQAFNMQAHRISLQTPPVQLAGVGQSHAALALVAQWFWQQQGKEQLKQKLALKSIWEHLERETPVGRLAERVVQRLRAYARNSISGNKQSENYLLMASLSQNSFLKREVQRLMPLRFVDIPDQERLLLFGIRRIDAE